jgi:hypothetical protein
LHVVVRPMPVPIMTNNTRKRDEGDSVTAQSREAKRASEARARQQESQIAQIHVTMLQQQEQMRRHQEEMLLQRNEIARMARLGNQGNANNIANFGQQVLDASGLAIAEDSIPSNINLVGDYVLSQDYMMVICECLGISPDDVALERVVPSIVRRFYVLDLYAISVCCVTLQV